jgi:hypothetical protein
MSWPATSRRIAEALMAKREQISVPIDRELRAFAEQAGPA